MRFAEADPKLGGQLSLRIEKTPKPPLTVCNTLNWRISHYFEGLLISD